MNKNKIEIYWKLVRVKLYSNKLFLWKELKNQIYNSIKKWVKEWFLHNKKMHLIGEWETNILVSKKIKYESLK